MIYSEAAYFDGNHCAHMVAREDHERTKRRAKIAREFERRTGSRARRV